MCTHIETLEVKHGVCFQKIALLFLRNDTKTFHVTVLLQSGENVEFADQIRHMHKQTLRKHCLIIDPAAKKCNNIFYEKSISLKF